MPDVKTDKLTATIAKEAHARVCAAIEDFRQDVHAALSKFKGVVGRSESAYPKEQVKQTEWWAGYDELSQLMLLNLAVQPSPEAKKQTWPKGFWSHVETQVAKEVMEKMGLLEKMFARTGEATPGEETPAPNAPGG